MPLKLTFQADLLESVADAPWQAGRVTKVRCRQLPKLAAPAAASQQDFAKLLGGPRARCRIGKGRRGPERCANPAQRWRSASQAVARAAASDLTLRWSGQRHRQSHPGREALNHPAPRGQGAIPACRSAQTLGVADDQRLRPTGRVP